MALINGKTDAVLAFTLMVVKCKIVLHVSSAKAILVTSLVSFKAVLMRSETCWAVH